MNTTPAKLLLMKYAGKALEAKYANDPVALANYRTSADDARIAIRAALNDKEN